MTFARKSTTNLDKLTLKSQYYLLREPRNKRLRPNFWLNFLLFCALSVVSKYKTRLDSCFVSRSLGFVRPCICQSMYIFKRAKVGGAVRPHTDGTFLMTTGNLLGLWTPLENATIENGCLWFEPGSHRSREITSFFERTTNESSGETVMKLRHTQPPPSEEELNLVPVEMKAGDLVLIHKVPNLLSFLF